MDRLKLAELKGYLAAFANINTYTDHGATYTFEPVPEHGPALTSLSRHIRPDYTYELTPVQDWHDAVRAALTRWFFEHAYETTYADVTYAQLTDNQQAGVDGFIRLLDEAFDGAAFTVSELHVDPSAGPFYECDWTDYVFATDAALYLLHLGVSD